VEHAAHARRPPDSMLYSSLSGHTGSDGGFCRALGSPRRFGAGAPSPRIRLELMPPGDLAPHERVVPERVEAVLQAILAAKALYKPVIVDEATLTVIDGHHRLHALKLLGARRVPVLLVDYEHDIYRIDPAPKPATQSLLLSLAHTSGSTWALIVGRRTRTANVDPIDVYKALARTTPQASPTAMSAPRLIPPPPEPWIIRELATRRLLLPPRTTIHKTWAKHVILRIPLNLLLL
jgi:hypothetical protein